MNNVAGNSFVHKGSSISLNYFLRKNFHKVGQVDERVELLGRFLIVKYVYGSTGGTLLEVTGSGR